MAGRYRDAVQKLAADPLAPPSAETAEALFYFKRKVDWAALPEKAEIPRHLVDH
jgi:hypothetical protein